MIAVYLRTNASNETRVKMGEKQILSELYTPYSDEYENYCIFFKDAIEQYKDQELVEYEPTKYEKRMMKEDPEFAENIPKYYIPGYDELVGARFPSKARNEFLTRFKNSDPEIVEFINKYNKFYKAKLI